MAIEHVLVHEDVTIIGNDILNFCSNLISITMFDKVVKIEDYAFSSCINLKSVRFSKSLTYIGRSAFASCCRIRSYSIPSTVTHIGENAFADNECLRYIAMTRALPTNKLPNLLDSAIYTKTARRFGIAITYGGDGEDIRGVWETYLASRVRRRTGGLGRQYVLRNLENSNYQNVNRWLNRYLEDEYPFHRICFDSCVTTNELNDYFNEGEGRNSNAALLNEYNRASPLHMLSMNPHAPEDAFAMLFKRWKHAIFKKDLLNNTPLQYAEIHNVRGLIAMIGCLCEHRVAVAGTTTTGPKPWLGRLRVRKRKIK
ncbi:MAG: leucine-rich repeat domain-containing protein [Desulfobacteraceae bacterium]|nr:leucine-rich repeat domain-containing protein [Desulfobacteraceae bacterium]